MRVFISMTISMVVGFWVSAFKAATTFVHSLGDAIQHRLYNSPAKAVEPSKGIETSAAKGILESGRSVVDSGVDLVSGILRAPVKILRRARNRHT